MRRLFVAGIGIISLAGAAIGVGVTAASASPAVTKTEEFRLVTGSATSPTFGAIATGAFTAGGTFTPGNPGTASFPGGTFKVTDHVTKSTSHLNQTTCLYSQLAESTYQLSGGTGKYAGIKGSGTSMGQVLAVLSRNAKGKCSLSILPAAYQQIITAHGPISGV